MRQRGSRFWIALAAAASTCALSAAPAAAAPSQSLVVPPFNYTVGVPAHMEITLINTSNSGEIVDWEAVSQIPGCANTNAYCSPTSARDPGLFTLSPEGTGIGDAENCFGTWEIVETSQNPGHWRLVPGPIGYVEAGPGQYCTVSFTATANRLPAADFNPGTDGVQTNLILNDHAWFFSPTFPPTYLGNQTGHNWSEVTVLPGAPATPVAPAAIAAAAAAAPTGRRDAALAACKKKKSKKKRKKCRKAALLQPA